MPISSNANVNSSDIEKKLAVLRVRFLESMDNTFKALRDSAEQLKRAPKSGAVLESLRRELHRVHGTAGSYGYLQASSIAGEMERQAIRWNDNPDAQLAERHAVISRFVDDLEAVFKSENPSLDIPLKKPGEPSQVADPLVASPEVSDSGEVHVFVVEDDVALSDMIRYAIESLGLTVQVFRTGTEALDALLAYKSGSQKALVLLDLDLPGIDGHAINERLNVVCPDDYAVVFMSVRTGEAEQLRALKAGAIDYLTKPINLRVLLAKVPIWRSMVSRW